MSSSSRLFLLVFRRSIMVRAGAFENARARATVSQIFSLPQYPRVFPLIKFPIRYANIYAGRRNKFRPLLRRRRRRRILCARRRVVPSSKNLLKENRKEKRHTTAAGIIVINLQEDLRESRVRSFVLLHCPSLVFSLSSSSTPGIKMRIVFARS